MNTVPFLVVLGSPRCENSLFSPFSNKATGLCKLTMMLRHYLIIHG